MDLAAEFIKHFPIASGRFSLELVPDTVVEAQPDGWRTPIRLFLWDTLDDGKRAIRDIREQEVQWLPAEAADDPRVAAYLEGWAAAVRAIFERHEERLAAGAEIDKSNYFDLPADLVCPEVLQLRRPQAADEFTETLLASKQRLGRFLP